MKLAVVAFQARYVIRPFLDDLSCDAFLASHSIASIVTTAPGKSRHSSSLGIAANTAPKVS